MRFDYKGQLISDGYDCMGTVVIMSMDGKCEYRQKCWQVQVAVSIYAYRFNVKGCILTQ